MKNMFVKIAAITSFSFISTFSQAALIASISHDYGSQQHIASSLVSGGSCDTMNSDSVTIRNSSNCQRFYDLFDFSSFNYDSIDSFELTLSFAATNNNGSGLAILWNYEQWAARPASTTNGANQQSNLSRQGNLYTQTFTFDSSNTNVFADILNDQTFSLWFSHNGLGQQSFQLADAKLDVFGTLTEVSEPAPLALFSLSLIAMALVKRRKN